MSRVVWKFPLGTRDMPTLEMPAGAEVLSVAEQHNRLCLWALVDPEAPLEWRRFCIRGTGLVVPDEHGRFVGSAWAYGGDLVFHVWEMP